MKSKTLKLLIITAALSLIVGGATLTVARDSGAGDNTQQDLSSQRCKETRGTGGHHQRGDSDGVKAQGLDDSQIEALQAARDEFQNATRDLRSDLQSKRLALRSELAKKSPDAETALSLQTEISAMNAELAQKRIEHILEMKKITPYAGLGRMQSDTDGAKTGPGRRNT